MAVIVDSSVLVAAFHVKDSLHEMGAAVVADAQKPVLVPEYVAIETAGVLALRAHDKVAKEFIQVLLEGGDLQVLRLPHDHFYSTAAYFSETKSRLSFVDCSLAVLSRDFDVLTFDKTLTKAIKAPGR